MFPDDATPVDTNANEVWLNEAGCTGFWVEPAEAMLATQVLLVAWSTAYDDNDNLAFILDLAAADYDAATPTALPFEVMVVSAIDKLPRMILWDGVNTIKTISMRWSGINGGAVETYTVTLNTMEPAV